MNENKEFKKLKHKEKMKVIEYKYGYISGIIIAYFTILNALIVFILCKSFFSYSCLIIVLGMLINLGICCRVLTIYIRKLEKRIMKYKFIFQ